MMDVQTLIAGLVLILWTSAAAWVLRSELQRWWRRRGAPPSERRRLGLGMAAEPARVIEELAEPHRLPSWTAHPRG